MQGIISNLIFKPYYHYRPEELAQFAKTKHHQPHFDFPLEYSPSPLKKQDFNTKDTNHNEPNFLESNDREGQLQNIGNLSWQSVSDFKVQNLGEVDRSLDELGVVLRDVEEKVRAMGELVQGKSRQNGNDHQQQIKQIKIKIDINQQHSQPQPSTSNNQSKIIPKNNKRSLLGFYKQKMREDPKKFDLNKFKKNLNYQMLPGIQAK